MAPIGGEHQCGDQVIEEGGARVFADAEAAPMLDSAELDPRQEDDQVAFGFYAKSSVI